MEPDSALLAKLTQHQQRHQSAGLNGTTEQARADLAEALLRGLDLEEFTVLVDALEPEGETPEPEADPALPGDWDGVLSVSEAERHLRLAGIGDDEPVLLTLYGGGKASQFFPPPELFWTDEEIEAADRKIAAYKGDPKGRPTRSQLIRWDWGAVMDWHETRMRAGQGRPWGEIRAALKAERGRSLGYIANPGGTGTRKRGCEILEVRSITCESDSPEFTAEQKAGAWRAAGLSEPSALMDTGNKSVHLVFRLDAPLTVEEGQHLARRLNHTLTQRTGMPMDTSLESACSVYRLAGGRHPKTGQMARLIGESSQPCRVAELEPLLLEAERRRAAGAPVGETVTVRESDDGEIVVEPLCPLPLELPDGKTFPLLEALGPWRRRVLERGLISGSVAAADLSKEQESWSEEVVAHYEQRGRACPGRFVMAWSLSCALQAAELQLQEMGVPYSSSARELFIQYGERCTPELAPEQIEGNWESGENFGETDKSELYLHRQISRWAKQHGYWKPNADQIRRAKAQVAEESGREWHQLTDWVVTALLTPERVIEEALRLKAEIEKAPLTCYQGRFLRYSPAQGYFQHIPANTLKREIAEVLPKVHIVKKFEDLLDEKGDVVGQKAITSHKFSTEAKATACVKWLNTVLFAERMDVVPAVAFTNGTYLIEHEQLVPHNPDFRLTWAIQGRYEDQAECPPLFRQFLISSFGEEWIEVVRMVLRYLVDPTFKPSKVVMILGKSGSGKGTLERLIEAMFPASCISVITSGFADINHPDKIRQFVRGKRLVSFPDLQGRQVGVGTIYSMTDGGLLTSRTLHESDADEGEPFTGRVVICSTQPPVMEDAGNGMTRRMLVLQTRMEPNRVPDVDLDDKLRGELGAIVSWALQADRQEVKRMLAIGDQAGLLAAAGLDAEVRMDAVRSFIDCCLAPSPAGELVLPDKERLFAAFRVFCDDRNYKPMSQNSFVSRLAGALPHLRIERRAVPGTNSQQKVAACFWGFDLAPGLAVEAMSYQAQLEMKHLAQSRDLKLSLDRRKYVEGGLGDLRQHQPELPDLAEVWKCQNADPAEAKGAAPTAVKVMRRN